MARPVVIDASLALRLVLPGPDQPRLQALAARWIEEGVTLQAPALWLYEVTSALSRATHLGALTAGEARRALGLVAGLGVALNSPDEGQAALALDWTQRLARAAAYDSFYLALAETLQCELWTADRHLQNAAGVPWVHCVAEA